MPHTVAEVIPCIVLRFIGRPTVVIQEDHPAREDSVPDSLNHRHLGWRIVEVDMGEAERFDFGIFQRVRKDAANDFDTISIFFEISLNKFIAIEVEGCVVFPGPNSIGFAQ